ncbi:EamA/RhaT family transporter, partial [Pseudomonas syringae pv. actinidifoliorum]|nr:EamA/RhaT family transporter [Pseudomonas syringae pv. actinidifoliorum]
FSYCQIVFAGLLGFLVFDHMPSPTAQAGIAIICLSGLAAAWQQRRNGG